MERWKRTCKEKKKDLKSKDQKKRKGKQEKEGKEKKTKDQKSTEKNQKRKEKLTLYIAGVSVTCHVSQHYPEASQGCSGHSSETVTSLNVFGIAALVHAL